MDRANTAARQLFEGALGSPTRNLAVALIFVAIVWIAATLGFVAAGWSVSDAFYMVTLTIFSVGYGEVHPIDTPWLRALDISTIILGCTGMIVLTGALVQAFAHYQVTRLLGLNRMHNEIDKLSGHSIVCGLGRIGSKLAAQLHQAKSPFVVIDRDAGKIAEARGLGYLCIQADATEEEALREAGIDRAHVLASVLPNDAANVFITLSARSLNGTIQIIARGEAPTTENKLIHAGADKVVMPTHIGAEHIAEQILYPHTDRLLDEFTAPAGTAAQSGGVRPGDRGRHRGAGRGTDRQDRGRSRGTRKGRLLRRPGRPAQWTGVSRPAAGLHHRGGRSRRAGPARRPGVGGNDLHFQGRTGPRRAKPHRLIARPLGLRRRAGAPYACANRCSRRRG